MIRIAPLELVDYEDCHQALPSAEHIECPKCLKTFLGSAVVNDDPMFCYMHRQHLVVRRLYCDFCNHLVIWEQACDSTGKRLGLVLSKPGIFTGRSTLARFLHAFPQAAGVLQS